MSMRVNQSMQSLVMLSEPLMLALAKVSGVAGRDATPTLCWGVLELSRLFTRELDAELPPYLDDAGLRTAYEAYYLPVNIAKVQSLLKELPSESLRADTRTGPFAVLDLGSGPGSALLAALDWLPSPLAAVAVDHSAAALQSCTRYWEAYLRVRPRPGAQLSTMRADLHRLHHLPEGTYDLIMMANTLNELFRSDPDPIRRRAALVRELLDRLHPTGTLMIVEPALRVATRNLHRLRDILVQQQACTVYSPCLHEHPCPALAREDDWCHEERPWTPPPIVAAIDREVGFIKDALKFSYLLLRKDGLTIVPRDPAVYRVVSELREMKGEKRAWLCNETGRPEVGRLDRERSEINAAFDAWHRGAIVRVEQIVRRDRRGRQGLVGRIPATAAVEVIRPACGA